MCPNKLGYSWSKPFYGVSHLLGVGKDWQVTVEAYETFVRAYALCFRSNHPFTAVAEQEFSKPEDARKWGERYAHDHIRMGGI